MQEWPRDICSKRKNKNFQNSKNCIINNLKKFGKCVKVVNLFANNITLVLSQSNGECRSIKWIETEPKVMSPFAWSP